MTQSYTRPSATEWAWREGRKTHSVRYFPQTQRLIWSGWMPTSDGPVFDEGYAQSVEDFLANGISNRTPPPALLDELRETVTRASGQSQRSIWSRFFGRRSS